MLIINMSRPLAMRVQLFVVVILQVHKLTTAEGGLPKVSISVPQIPPCFLYLVHQSQNPVPFLMREAELIH
jgi:hypothetical protein